MTGEQVIQAIKLALDKYSASTSAVIGPAFLDEELCEFANQAMVELICTKFTGNNQLQQGFDSSVKRISDFANLICTTEHVIERKSANIWTTDQITDRSYLFVVSTVVVANNELIPAELIDRTTAQKYVKTPYNYPWIPTPKVVVGTRNELQESGCIDVYVDPDWDYQNMLLRVEYVKQPSLLKEDNLINDAFDNAFSDNVLYEIINKAALFALDNIESQRINTKVELNKIQE